MNLTILIKKKKVKVLATITLKKEIFMSYWSQKRRKESDLICSVVGATKEPTNRNKLDLFGEYVATKMIKLSQKLDEDAIESLEYDIATVLMKARHKTGLIQTWLNYY